MVTGRGERAARRDGVTLRIRGCGAEVISWMPRTPVAARPCLRSVTRTK